MPKIRQTLIEQFLESARRVGKTLWAGREACFQDSKLHPAQVRVLYFVKHRQPVTVGQVAEAMAASPSAATQIVESLVKIGYLERTATTADRRKVVLHLSKRGLAKFAKFRQEHVAWVSKILRPLSDRELRTLIALHAKIASAPKSHG